MTSRELELRRRTLGSSEIGAVAGHSPYRNLTPMSVWESKLFGSQQESSTAMLAGSYFERGIAEWCLAELGEAKFGWRLRKMTRRVHPKEKWVSATCDFRLRRNKEKGPIIECKYVGPGMEHLWDPDDPQGVPAHIEDQVRWQMACTNDSKVYIAAFLAGKRRFAIYERTRDLEIERELIEIGRRFWKDHVVAQVPPPLDESEASARLLERMFSVYNEDLVPASAEAERLAEEYVLARERKKAAEEDAARARQKLCWIIGNHAGVESWWGKATWKHEKQGRVDKTRMLEWMMSFFTPEQKAWMENMFRKPKNRVFRLSAKTNLRRTTWDEARPS